MERQAFAAALVAYSLFCCVTVEAADPLYVKNLSPVIGLFGLPSQRSAATESAGSLSLAWHTAVANHYVVDSDVGELLTLDGETLRSVLELRYGLVEDWDLQLEIPWLRHDGGFLDSPIDNWHKLWGFGDGGRNARPQDLLEYSYTGQQADFALSDDSSGLGDISLALSHTLFRGDSAVVSAALGYKFGTGDEQKFLGSGADDLFLSLRYSDVRQNLSWHGQLGVLRTGDTDILGASQQQDLWFAGVALDWAVTAPLSLIAQLDMHAAPMDSSITGIGDEAVLLTLGARWRITQQWQADLSFIEDIRVETAPDFTLQASLQYYPAR